MLNGRLQQKRETTVLVTLILQKKAEHKPGNNGAISVTDRQSYPISAKRRAKDLLVEHGITSAPVIPESIAKTLQLRIGETDQFPQGAYGALMLEEGVFSILISTGCPTDGMRRFTIAHELGHFCLDGHVQAILSESAPIHVSIGGQFRGHKRPWFELEADAFASEIIVPADLARVVVKKAVIGLSCVRQIADTFIASLSCAAVRYAELSPDPVAVVLSHSGTIEWVSLSAAFREHRFARAFMRGEWAPPQSATKRLASNADAILQAETNGADGYLDEWFPDGPRIQVREEVLGLGSYGRVLTVLHSPDLPSEEQLAERQRREERGPTTWTAGLREWNWDSFEEANED